jgi:tetratricopeptide (TPR) repeat protein
MTKSFCSTLLLLLLILCCTMPAAASRSYDEIPSDANAVAYDLRLKQLEIQQGLLWSQPFFTTAPYGSKTFNDAWTCHTLSYSLKPCAKEDNNYILPMLNRSILEYAIGDYDNAFHSLLDAKGIMDSMNQKGFSLGAERSKIFKGESYEQAMACMYMGFMLYEKKDFQNARAMFSQALELDREIIPDPKRLESLSKSYASTTKGASPATLSDMYQAYGNDNRLAYYMLARTYQKLGDEQNARISLANTGNWTQVPDFLKDISCGKGFRANVNNFDTQPPEHNAFTEPEEFAQDNTIILIQMGSAPEKKLGGFDGNKDMLNIQAYAPRKAEVYVDGRFLAEAYPLYNMMHQAACLSRTSKDTSQTGKAIGKFFLTVLASAVSDDLGKKVQNGWSVAADTRYWGTVPNEIHLVAAKLPDGRHTISVVFYDQAGNRLKHFEQVHYYVPVVKDEETFLMVRALRDKFNTQRPFFASKVLKLDLKTNQMQFNPGDIGGVKVGQRLDIIEASYGDDAANQKFMTSQQHDFNSDTLRGPQIRIAKVGAVTVSGLPKKTVADAQIVAGSPVDGKTYFITNYQMASDEILESSNEYQK